MKKLISLLVIPMILINMSISILAYSDTYESTFGNEIGQLSQLGIISGFDDDTFKPHDNVTRSQAAKMFAVATGFTEDTYKNIASKNIFPDLNMEHWAYKYADYLIKGDGADNSSIISGFEDGTFRPDENVTIIQIIKMAVCSLGEGYATEAIENGAYPNGYYIIAEKYGFTEGLDITDINAAATREQTAKIISNTIDIPLKKMITMRTISNNHELSTTSFWVTYDGKKHYPITTLKTMLISGDWGQKNVYTDVSPIDEADEFFANVKILNISSSEIEIEPKDVLRNTDGSAYLTTESFKAANNGFELDKNADYYMRFGKINGVWTLIDYALCDNLES